MKNNISYLILAGLFATATALPASVILVSGFGTPETDDVLTIADLDGNWHTNDGNAKVFTSTTLTSEQPLPSPASFQQRPYEEATGILIDNTGGTYVGSKIKFSFDYNVLAGTPSVFFHLAGIDETGGAPGWSGQFTATNGTLVNSMTETNTETYNLFNDTLYNPFASLGGYQGGQIDLTGSGTISATIDLSSYTLSNLSDYEYFVTGFGFNLSDGIEGIEISNFTVFVPEPSSTALLGLGLSSLLLRRRRS